ncbi:MAG: YihY/virulence factor BrkB family protein [Dehalococcoidia bacterium]
MSKYLTVLKRAVGSFGKDNCTSYAAATSYWALLSLFPLVVFLLSFAGFFIHSEQQKGQIVDSLFKALGQGVDKNTLYAQVNAHAGGSSAASIIGLLLAAWSASAVFGAVRTGINVVFNVTKARPMLRSKLLDLGMVLGIGLLLALSLAATGVLTALQSFSNQIFGSSLGVLPHLAFALLYLIIPPAISFAAFGLVYYIVPHAELRLKDAWLGALVAAVLFQIVQIGFAVYAANIGHFDKVYGALAGVIAFLFFMYVSANIIFLGAEVTKEYVEVLGDVKPPVDVSEPESGPKQNLEQKAVSAVKGLLVDDSPHHDTSVPYEPARDTPMQPPAPLVKEKDANPEISSKSREDIAGHRGQR